MITTYENKMLNNKYENKETKVEKYFAQMTFNKKVHGRKPGTVERIQVDKNGTPLDKHLRRRLKDSPIDNCVSLEILKKSPVDAEKSGYLGEKKTKKALNDLNKKNKNKDGK
jgi:hypothetical protein